VAPSSAARTPARATFASLRRRRSPRACTPRSQGGRSGTHDSAVASCTRGRWPLRAAAPRPAHRSCCRLGEELLDVALSHRGNERLVDRLASGSQRVTTSISRLQLARRAGEHTTVGPVLPSAGVTPGPERCRRARARSRRQGSSSACTRPGRPIRMRGEWAPQRDLLLTCRALATGRGTTRAGSTWDVDRQRDDRWGGCTPGGSWGRGVDRRHRRPAARRCSSPLPRLGPR
jgi:hypothetical protein